VVVADSLQRTLVHLVHVLGVACPAVKFVPHEDAAPAPDHLLFEQLPLRVLAHPQVPLRQCRLAELGRRLLGLVRPLVSQHAVPHMEDEARELGAPVWPLLLASTHGLLYLHHRSNATLVPEQQLLPPRHEQQLEDLPADPQPESVLGWGWRYE